MRNSRDLSATLAGERSDWLGTIQKKVFHWLGFLLRFVIVAVAVAVPIAGGGRSRVRHAAVGLQDSIQGKSTVLIREQ
jgi:hypothetical protein